MAQEKALYSDELAEITKDGILLHKYYLTGGDKKIAFTQIEKIIIQKPAPGDGRWRVWGAGFPRLWFPYDGSRMQRDKMFLIHLKDTKFRIGFTVTDSNAVEIILRQKRIIKNS